MKITLTDDAGVETVFVPEVVVSTEEVPAEPVVETTDVAPEVQTTE